MMTERTVSLPRLHPAQRLVISQASRYNVVCCGRRWGKSTLGTDRLIRAALAGYPAGWFSPTYRMLTEVWRAVRERLAPVTVRVSATEHRIELLTRGVVEMWSLDNPDAARGRAYARIVVDEAALVRGLADAWQKVIRPTLTDHQGDAWFCSTPRGMNDFFALWQRGQGPERGEWAAWQMPSSSNPYLDPAELEAARRELPALIFAQEFLAEFIPDGAGVFRRVQEAATAEPQDGPIPGHQYLVSVDWGKHEDFTVIVVWDLTERAMAALDRFQHIDYVLQLGRVQAMCERFRPVALVPERNSMGEPLLEQLLRAPWAPAVQPFLTTNATKAAAVETFALALERGEVRILPDPVLIGELLAFAAERLPSGLLRYGAPSGQHDDCVLATVIGWQAAAPAGRAVFSWLEGDQRGGDSWEWDTG